MGIGTNKAAMPEISAGANPLPETPKGGLPASPGSWEGTWMKPFSGVRYEYEY